MASADFEMWPQLSAGKHEVREERGRRLSGMLGGAAAEGGRGGVGRLADAPPPVAGEGGWGACV